MSTLADALRKRFRTPADVVAALGLDLKLLALDGAQDAAVNKPREKVAGNPGGKEKGSMAKTMTKTAAQAIRMLAPIVRSKLAADKQVDLRPALVGLTFDDIRDRKPQILVAIEKAVRGKLAKDTSLGEVAEFLDMLDRSGGGNQEEMDAAVEPEVQTAMEKTAGPAPPAAAPAPPKEKPPMKAPAPVEEEGAPLDEPDEPLEEAPPEEEGEGEDPVAKVAALLEGKLDPAIIQQVLDLLKGGGAHAHDAEGGEAKLEELGAAHDEGEPEQERKDDAQEWRREGGATDDLENEKEVYNMAQTGSGKQAKDQPPGTKGAPRPGGKMAGDAKNYITKEQMEAALKAATASVRNTEREIREAERRVQPWVGQLQMTFDSAEQVYRKALKMMGVNGIDKVHQDALLPILEMQPKPGARKQPSQRMAADSDSASIESFAQFLPDATRIRLS
jgi:hypothetical protein